MWGCFMTLGVNSSPVVRILCIRAGRLCWGGLLNSWLRGIVIIIIIMLIIKRIVLGRYCHRIYWGTWVTWRILKSSWGFVNNNNNMEVNNKSIATKISISTSNLLSTLNNNKNNHITNPIKMITTIQCSY